MDTVKSGLAICSLTPFAPTVLCGRGVITADMGCLHGNSTSGWPLAGLGCENGKLYGDSRNQIEYTPYEQGSNRAECNKTNSVI